MKHKPVIPPRKAKTPEEQALADDIKMINELYVRWVNNIYKHGDEFLIIQHMTRLEDIKAQADWMVKQQMYKMDWQSEQSNQKSSLD